MNANYPTIKKLLFILLITSLQLLYCRSDIKRSDSFINELLGINNQIIDELNNQHFDVVKTIKTDKSKYLIEVKINDIPKRLIIDTGASFCIINKKDSLKFNFKNTNKDRKALKALQTAFGGMLINEAIADTFEVAELTISSWPFMISDKQTNALLGSDFLHFISAVFICNPGMLLISTNQTPAKNLENILLNNGYSKIDLLNASNNVYFAPITIEEEKGICLIDTGSPYTVIDRAQINKSIWNIHPYRGHALVDAAKNRKTIYGVNLKNFSIGNYCIDVDFEVVYIELRNENFRFSTKQRLCCINNFMYYGHIIFK